MRREIYYSAPELIKEYVKLIQADYPSLLEEDISMICKYQFVFIKRRMEEGKLSTIRVKYLGSFRVFKGRVIGIKNRAVKFKDTNRITQKDFERIDEMCTKYLKDVNHTYKEVD